MKTDMNLFIDIRQTLGVIHQNKSWNQNNGKNTKNNNIFLGCRKTEWLKIQIQASQSARQVQRFLGMPSAA